MLRASRILLGLAFAAHSLLAPFWIVCHAPGPAGHDRRELAWGACCGNHEAPPPAAPACEDGCAEASECCGACHDEPAGRLDVARSLPGASSPADGAPACVPPYPPAASLPAVRALPRPEPPGGPPLFLTLRCFRI